jgi:hypothetical protein
MTEEIEAFASAAGASHPHRETHHRRLHMADPMTVKEMVDIVRMTEKHHPHVYCSSIYWDHVFYRVGMNSTHEFYLGVSQGKVIKLGVGPCDEEPKPGQMDIEYYACPAMSDSYIGHL